ncbi:ATP-binding protein [Halorubellus litoreus]|uniref:ATP-binding protein n=1 Tax=Halorubellus litoreus TaxID=755308 RepID=A0ABD5VBC8_9EURY
MSRFNMVVVTTGAVLVLSGLWIANTTLRDVGWLPEVGPSTVALTALIGPIIYYADRLSESGTSTTSNDDRAEIDPEDLKARTERWSEEAMINPAFPSGHGPEEASGDGNLAAGNESNEAAGDSDDTSRTSKDDTEVEDSEFEFNWLNETGVNFADIGGMEGQKQELLRDVITPLSNREKANALGVTAPNIVFHGPPGTGKTYLAKALATELDLPVALLSGADIQSKWINESASTVRALFAEAQEVASSEGGAVVFIDEVDSVLKQRTGGGNTHEEDTKVVNEFLGGLEETGEHNIVFIGATNRLNALDDAGMRSGRIDKKVHIGKPDTAAREAILRAQLDERRHDISDAEIKELAARTDEAVAADLKAIIDKAAKKTLVRGGTVVRSRDLR